MAGLTAPVDQIKRYTGILIYGSSGTRKSTLANTAPRPLKVLAFDGGYSRSRWVQHSLFQPQSWPEVLDQTRDLDGIETVVVDTIGYAVRLLERDIKRNYPKVVQRSGIFKRDGWMMRNEMLQAWLAELEAKCNRVLIAHDSGPETADDMCVPVISGKVLDMVTQDVDLIGYTAPMDSRAGRERYGIDFRSTPMRPFGKPGDDLGLVPDVGDDPVMLSRLFLAAKEKVRENALESMKESEALDAFFARIESADLDALTDLAVELKTASLLEQEHARAPLAYRVKALGAKWNADQGRYILGDDPGNGNTE